MRGVSVDLMGGVRSNLRGISCLALIAMAIQIALAFDHVARDGTFPLENDGKPIFSQAPTPTQDSNGLVELYCPICTAIRSSATPTTSSALPLPAMYGRSEPMAPRQVALAERPLNFARARAPPLAHHQHPVLSRYSSRIWSRADILSGHNWTYDSKCERCYARA